MKKLLMPGLALLVVLAIALGLHGWSIWHIYYRADPNPKPDLTPAIMASKKVEVTPLRDGLFMLRGHGGNVVALIDDEGTLIVDSEEQWMAPKLRSALADLGAGDVTYLIDTHFHRDHTGGNTLFGQQGATIIAHEETRRRLLSGDYGELDPASIPTVLIEDEHVLDFGGQKIWMWHAPLAHTNSDIVVHFEGANVVAAGDVAVNGLLIWLSKNSKGTMAGHIAGMKRLRDLINADTIIAPGHGPVMTRDDLDDIIAMYEKIQFRITLAKKLGVSRRLIVLANPLAPVPASWNVQPSWAKFMLRRYYDMAG
ncbi:MAG: MBL fold metallo-hydrolase [Marinibacterium sp.]